LRRLGIFSGGWTAVSAAAVVAEPFEDANVIDAALKSLVATSLIVADATSPSRFRLLDSIRDSLAPSWTEAERALTAARHARYFADFVAEADRRHYQAPLRTVIGTLLPELDNIRAAINWALGERNDLDLGCAMVGALGYAWRIIAYHEGERLIDLALRAAADPASCVGDRTRARLYRASAEFEIRLHPGVLDSAKRSIEIYEALRMDIMAAESRRLYGFLLHRNGRVDEAIVELSEAAVTFALGGEPISEGRALSDLAVPVWMHGKRAYANTLNARAVAGATASGDRREASRMGLNFAECQFHTGDVDAAIRTATEAFVRCEGADLQEILASNLAAYFLVQRSAAEAKRYARLCLDLCCEIAAPVSRPVQHLAGVAAMMGPEMYATSLRLLGFVNEQLRIAKERRDRTEQVTYDLTLRLLASAFDEPDREAVMVVGARTRRSRSPPRCERSNRRSRPTITGGRRRTRGTARLWQNGRRAQHRGHRFGAMHHDRLHELRLGGRRRAAHRLFNRPRSRRTRRAGAVDRGGPDVVRSPDERGRSDRACVRTLDRSPGTIGAHFRARATAADRSAGCACGHAGADTRSRGSRRRR
jgi:tetratricopeptide (TPR) repeat protein